jgi:hypothetical protein
MTSAQLQLKWAQRDSQYANRRVLDGGLALSEDEVVSVVWWRKAEAAALKGLERTKAMTLLSAWVSPRGRRS